MPCVDYCLRLPLTLLCFQSSLLSVFSLPQRSRWTILYAWRLCKLCLGNSRDMFALPALVCQWYSGDLPQQCCQQPGVSPCGDVGTCALVRQESRLCCTSKLLDELGVYWDQEGNTLESMGVLEKKMFRETNAGHGSMAWVAVCFIIFTRTLYLILPFRAQFSKGHNLWQSLKIN